MACVWYFLVDYGTFCRKITREKQENLLAETGEKRIVQDRDGRLKNILKKTYLRRWIDPLDASGNEAETHHEGIISNKRSNYNIDFARFIE